MHSKRSLLREAQKSLCDLDLYESSKAPGKYHHPLPVDRGASCRRGCGAGPELRPTVHRYAVPE